MPNRVSETVPQRRRVDKVTLDPCDSSGDFSTSIGQEGLYLGAFFSVYT